VRRNRNGASDDMVLTPFVVYLHYEAPYCGRRIGASFYTDIAYLLQSVINITMRTISHVVEEVIARSPFLAEAIAEGVANNAKIARKIKPEVEERLLEAVSEAAIAMALHRLAKDLKRSHYGMKMLSRMKDVTVRSGLSQFILENSVATVHALDTLSKVAYQNKAAFFNHSRGLHETVLIVGQELEKEAEALFKKLAGVKHERGLSAITMHMPQESLAVPGVYYPILKAIAHEGLSIVEVMSVYTEFTVIFQDKDVEKAFSVIKKVTS